MVHESVEPASDEYALHAEADARMTSTPSVLHVGGVEG